MPRHGFRVRGNFVLKEFSKSNSSTQEFLNKSIIDENTNYTYIIDIYEDINVLANSISKIWSVVQHFNKYNKTSKIWILTRQAQYIYEDDIQKGFSNQYSKMSNHLFNIW